MRHDSLAKLPEFISALVLGGHRGDQIVHVYVLAKSVLQLNPSVRSLRAREDGVLCIVVRVSTVETVAVAALANPLPIDTKTPVEVAVCSLYIYWTCVIVVVVGPFPL